MGTLHYSSNNSGGRWWLTDKNWRDLEKAGWTVYWSKDNDSGFMQLDEDGRWLGALATSCEIACDDPEKGISEWEQITGCYATDEGCNCCGEPHNFTYTDDQGNDHYSSVERIVSGRWWS